ncbi:hypothetical protein ACM61V_12330 [Sphingomonas sp. TX0543]|uniref:hypothetical protein n=1 Tax=unclassified Sphingomonas TaxID=196159 RepID=UPI0010F582BE|nr:hypothetical protein [Sphingomonas sp. 3P27F8]
MMRQGDFIEISPGEPILVADFNTPWPEAEPPPAHFREADGRWTLPFAPRAVTVTHADGGALHGSIQPRIGPERITLRSPWPQDVAEAFDRIAGVMLPDSIHQAAWRMSASRAPHRVDQATVELIVESQIRPIGKMICDCPQESPISTPELPKT